MNEPKLYTGVWPQNVSKLAKYAVRFIDGLWKITVLYEAEEGLRYLAIEGSDGNLADKINAVKSLLGNSPGGAFYINEYKHVIVPVAASESDGVGSLYYFVKRIDSDFIFKFEGELLSTKPIGRDGKQLKPGDLWVGPRPGIPYVLAAGSRDIYYESPALINDGSLKIRPYVTRKVKLSKIILDKSLLEEAIAPIEKIRGYQGGRFYVNEHGAIFTPVNTGNGNGIDYIYCGKINYDTWFPEPDVFQ